MRCGIKTLTICSAFGLVVSSTVTSSNVGAAGPAPAQTAVSSVVYTGDLFAVAGWDGPTLAVDTSASSPACVAGRVVHLTVDLDLSGQIDADERFTLVTSTEGRASVTVPALAAGRYQVVAEVPATAQCAPSAVAVDLLVANPRAQVSAVGWYDYPGIGSAHLRVQIHSRVGTSRHRWARATNGSLTWRIPGLVRFDARVTGFTDTCPTGLVTEPGGRCAVVEGYGTVWRWNEPSSRRGGWTRQRGDVWFTLTVEDDAGGVDRVRMYLPGFEFLSKTAGLLPLRTGHVQVP